MAIFQRTRLKINLKQESTVQILPSPIPQSFKITNEYVWLKDLHTLPVIISYDVTCGSDKDEFLPCFSFTRAEWASPDCDALSWYLSPHRDDFTFRTKLFRSTPTVQRLSPPWRPTVGTKFRVECEITETTATYSINEIGYATATYQPGEVPSQGYFGFARYGEANITVENVNIRSNTMSPATTDPAVDLEKTIDQFNSLASKDASKEKSLWWSWRFLQIYSTWGLRLPYTEATLKMQLGIADPLKYSFFGGMKEGYGKIHEASSEFITQIFPQVIDIGTSLLDFASDASEEDGELFNVVIELIDNKDFEGALELIGDLQATVQENLTKAGEVRELLGSYKSKLEDANSTVKAAQKLVDENEDTSQATIDKIQGGADVSGSIKNLEKLLSENEDAYDHAVVVASTTVTYAWVWPPVGLITAATVAGVYGSKAVDLLEEVERLEDQIKKTNAKLATAIETNKVQNSALQSLSKATSYTDLAISHTTVVQNSWQGIYSNLETVGKKVSAMTRERDEQVVLKGKASVKAYAKIAGKSWAKLVPPLKELTRDPYIVVEEGEKTYG
ncbi:MAG: hypothetical protein AAGC54_11540, partial [Cyanobacteria bacterium P01_F01_bin.4]